MSLTPTQQAHARAMVAEVHAYGLPERAAVIVIETALVESNILIYANPAVPDSMKLPHDAIGYDHYSVGPLQQQVPMWGTARDCMDPATSTRKFLDRLVGFNWQAMPTGEAAQRVQVSAYPDRYQQQEAKATAIVNALWSEVTDMQLTDTVVNPVTKKPVKIATYIAAIAVTEQAVTDQGKQLAAMQEQLAAIAKKLGA